MNSTVAAGYVVRHPDPDNRRAVRLGLTEDGERILASLAARHARALSRLKPAIAALIEA